MSGHPGLRTPQAKFRLLKKFQHLDDIKGDIDGQDELGGGDVKVVRLILLTS
jgi:hypothetical protein